MSNVQRALISVSDKSGIVDFAKELNGLGVEILSTGGTARALKEAGIHVKDVSEHTGFPEMMGGRVKTLHPKVFGGLLWRRNNPRDRQEADLHNIKSIDLLVVNLYPFEETITKKGVTLDEAIEQIDIGGPALLRAAAKNFKYVTVVIDPEDYSKVLGELEATDGEISDRTKSYLAKKVFKNTSTYDSIISQYLDEYS